MPMPVDKPMIASPARSQRAVPLNEAVIALDGLFPKLIT